VDKSPSSRPLVVVGSGSAVVGAGRMKGPTMLDEVGTGVGTTSSSSVELLVGRMTEDGTGEPVPTSPPRMDESSPPRGALGSGSSVGSGITSAVVGGTTILGRPVDEPTGSGTVLGSSSGSSSGVGVGVTIILGGSPVDAAIDCDGGLGSRISIMSSVDEEDDCTGRGGCGMLPVPEIRSGS
jgi:hypothetical protein